MSKNADKNLPDIAARLRQWREVLGLTQNGMARLLGVDYGLVRKHESGTSVPGSKHLLLLWDTGLNPTWLLTGTGEMTNGESADLLTHKMKEMKDALSLLSQERQMTVMNETIVRARDYAALESLIQDFAKKFS
jgi:transcriptional regulator with XRE-family HTH domain